ncbi:hypothetical protein SAPIO_CDS7506 [Scedosporium apiospermum]|uniref:Phosphotransferase n=1 Tax=Pseudallescheria apiosperma TaxID=563466 RepID=A0A084G221_PSEDA|nr:uncharacterized protein SAPIO_CDS7506 [Scedosporium apiospermum]KEZ41383.1 hypothetical protein SAPIO_CDS7506 [Scedosporium apiospermum]
MTVAKSLSVVVTEARTLPTPLAQYLSAFHVDSKKLLDLTRRFEATFRHLAANSQNQFLPTPILTSLLRPIGDFSKQEGCLNRQLAIDITPSIRIAAIANDSVATLVSFIYQYGETENRVPAMGLIVGTGCNATVTLPLEIMANKISSVSFGSEISSGPKHNRIAVNTEWTINGTAVPLRELGLITKWDEELDRAGESPGFQPLEYVTSGRYLGELGRIIFLDYLTTELGIAPALLPSALLERYAMSTTFLSYFGPPNPRFLEKLENAFPTATGPSHFRWNESHVEALYQIAQGIQHRAASILAAATISLLRVAGEVPPVPDVKSASPPRNGVKKLGVGYTGGCIVNFQNYLYDYEKLLSQIVSEEFGPQIPVEVELKPCHCGGITGAGILAAAVLASEGQESKS